MPELPELHENLFGDMVPLPRSESTMLRSKLTTEPAWKVEGGRFDETTHYTDRADAEEAIREAIGNLYVCPVCDMVYEDFESDAETCCGPKETRAWQCPECEELVPVEDLPESWDSQDPSGLQPVCPGCGIPIE